MSQKSLLGETPPALHVLLSEKGLGELPHMAPSILCHETPLPEVNSALILGSGSQGSALLCQAGQDNLLIPKPIACCSPSCLQRISAALLGITSVPPWPVSSPDLLQISGALEPQLCAVNSCQCCKSLLLHWRACSFCVSLGPPCHHGDVFSC